MSDNAIELVASTTKEIRETWFGADNDVARHLAEMAVKIEEIAHSVKIAESASRGSDSESSTKGD